LSATSGTLTLTAAQLTADAAVITKLGSAATIAVSDTATNINSNIAAISTNIANLDALSVSDGGTVNITATQTAVAAKLGAAASVALSDSAANIVKNIDAINTNIGNIDSLSTTSGTVTLTAAQVTTDAAVVAKLSAVAVSDTATNLNSDLHSLLNNAKVSGIAATEGTLSLSADNFSADTSVLSKLADGSLTVTGVSDAAASAATASAKVASFTVSDTATNLNSDLHSLLNNAKVSGIAATEGTLSLSADNFSADTSVLSKLADGSLTVTGVSDAAASAATASAKVASFTVSDSATNLNSDLHSLLNNAKVSGIAATEGTLSLSADQFASDASKLSKLVDGSLTVTGVDASDISSVAGNSHVASFTVSDSAADLGAALSKLSASDLSHVTAVAVTGDDASALDANLLAKLPAETDVFFKGVMVGDAGDLAKVHTIPCYVEGTHIQTKEGQKLVEDLVVGDLIKTVEGRYEPVIWIGSRRVVPAFQVKKDKAYPVRIVKDAFGEGLPMADLCLSPDHSVYVDGVMIPADKLINGKTIYQEECVQVTYFHVELPKHEAIYAEGLPAETYLDTSETNRAFFNQNQGDSKVFGTAEQMPAPKDVPLWRHIWDTQGYGKLHTSGPVVETVQARLSARADEMNTNAGQVKAGALIAA